MIKALTEQQVTAFSALFTQYYGEMGEEDIPAVLQELLLPDWRAELIFIDVAYQGEQAVGFVVWQVDGIENDWCIHEGWGDVRELYVLPSYRGKGIGKELLAFAEKELEGLPLFVLPNEECEQFFQKLGYQDSGEYESDTWCKIYVKNI